MDFEKLAALIGGIVDRIPAIKERYMELSNNEMDDACEKLLEIELFANTIVDILEQNGIWVELEEDKEEF